MDKKIWLLSTVIAATALTACSGDDNDSNGGTPSTGGDESKTPAEILADLNVTAPETYAFASKLANGSSVSYSGQTARQVLISDLADAVGALQVASAETADDIEEDLQFFIKGDDIDTTEHGFTLDGETVIPGPTYADISSGKNLIGKIAGGYLLENNTTAGEATRWANANGEFGASGRFYGWEDASATINRPIDLLNLFVRRAAEGSEGNGFAINGGAIDVDVAYLDKYGRDYKQLVQKFALGAVAFSQGTSDYLSPRFEFENVYESGDKYTTAEHHWDEGFGYFGAARNYSRYTDDEIAGKGGRDGWAKGYNDFDTSDGGIDLGSEINLANSTNCAKRDRGATDATNFTKEVFDAFLAGRAILSEAASRATLIDTDAANNGAIALTTAELAALNELSEIASVTWEKCVAATVVHYINDVTGDMDNFDNGQYADLANFTDLAKHWSEMKGFALGLQFNRYSPFNENAASVDKLEEILALMGDAPVLADGKQIEAQVGVDAYKTDLLKARSMLQDAYEFSQANVENW
ncbi:Uncharacterised protein [BD1-7 clade bacterium]|uniref:DUF4856 domain-containing protein n=1 Tax=BD1-7 clade bacterium TaxID=2029982 RepID=A0A5S9QWI9_9GAMM|nr:Uncharacterised protein [BD1-7 clade bacterium]